MLENKFEKLKEIVRYLKDFDINTLYSMSSNDFNLFKKDLEVHNINLIELNEEQRKELMFQTFSKDSKQYGLIPLYIFYLLKDNIELRSPLFKDSSIIEKNVANDDVRGKCVSYEFA